MSLHRALNSRQLCMIAIGGSIGTGLFLASGNTIHIAGTWGAIAGFLVVGVMVYFLMTSLGEMSAYQPVTGSFCEYASQYVSPGFGFAMTVNYWFNWAITLAAEISAGTIILQFWFPGASTILVGFIVMGLILALNLFSVRGFGESEYWLSLIKVAMVMIFILLGVGLSFGLFGYHQNYLLSQPIPHGFLHIHGWLTLFNVMLIAGFAFQGSELIGVAAGETENPRRDIPKAAKLIFWRILLFYILTIVVIGAFISAKNPHLIGASTQQVAYSPFTMIMTMAHVHFAAGIINFVILVAVFSAANSGTYASSRMLYQLGTRTRGFFSVLAKTNRRGVPVVGLIITLIVGSLAFLSSYWGNGALYTVLISASALSGFIAWIGIALSHLCFRRQFIRSGGQLKELPYRSRFYPYGSLFALITCLIILLGENYTVFTGARIHWTQALLTYSSLILFGFFWLAYGLTRFVRTYRSKVAGLNRTKSVLNTLGGE